MSRQGTRFAIIEETAGAIPATPAWDIMRLTNDALARTEERTDLIEFGAGGRGVADSTLQNSAASGTLAFKLARAPWLDLLLSASLGDDWGADGLGLGGGLDQCYTYNTIRAFAIEKRFDDNAGGYKYNRFNGVVANGVTLTLEAGEEISGEFDLICTDETLHDTELTDSTYTDAGSYGVMTAPLVSALEILDSLGDPIASLDGACITTANITITNNLTATGCIGTPGTPNKQLNLHDATTEFVIVYRGHALEELSAAGTEIQLRATMTDGDGNSYSYHFPRAIVTDAVVTAGAPDDTDPMPESATIRALLTTEDVVTKLDRVQAV